MEKLYRCEKCGNISLEEGECCNQQMSELKNPGCMGCSGCGH